VHDQASPPTLGRGLPRRHVVVATAVALVIAVAAGAVVYLSITDDDSDSPTASLELETPRDVVGAPAAVAYETFEGEPANTGAYVGRPLVLNFFAEWCAPCVAEMPAFEAVHREVGDEVAFLGLSLLEPEENALGLIERTGITYDVGRDADGTAYEHFAGMAMPTTVFIDAAGTVREVHSGPLTADELRERIDRHLR
jgi:cytochrome c biogenesis protein CcmG/thiol:disulfide interchange protein DsbE